MCVAGKTKEYYVPRKVVIYLKNHSDIWESYFEIVKWRLASRKEVCLAEFENACRDANKLISEASKKLKFLPNWMSKPLHTSIMTFTDKGIKLADCVSKVYSMYVKMPNNLTRALKSKSLDVGVLNIYGEREEDLRRELRRILMGLLSKGVIPLDYSLKQVIVVRRYKRPSLSVFNHDPIKVLKGFERPPATRFFSSNEAKRIVFEGRSTGWGLKAEISL